MTAPKPLGEALVVVQTDVNVPQRVSRMRVEVMRLDGQIVEQRDVVTPSPDDWPVSFSVVVPDGGGESDVWLRLRAYPDGHEISARELERLTRASLKDDVVARGSIEEACREAPTLRLAEPLTLRRGSQRITPLLRAQQCTEETVSGSAVAKLEITERGDYAVEIVSAVPDAANAEPGSDTAISLRTDCPFATTQLACAEQISELNHLSRISRITLDPGVYFVVTGGADPAPADLTILATRLDVFQTAPNPEPPLTADPAAFEPPPGVTIERLVAIHLVPGQRGRVDVMLRGECFGTPSDMAARATCIDTANQRVPVATEVPRGSLALDFPRPPPWPGELPVPCPSAAKDGEICVPGGAFILGDTLALEDLARRSRPERMRIVAPFFIDRQEMSVARYRDALRLGFKPPDATPLVNTEPVLTREKPTGMCTFSVDPLGRESLPLTCVSWTTARALCNFLGGDLPAEDQWEFAATAAGRDVETPYPWGRELPTCERTVYGRTRLPTAACPEAPLGPLPIDAPLLVAGDVTPLGVVGLAGNVEEMLATPFAPYSHAAWTRAGLRGAFEEQDAPLRASRGSDWSVGSLYATASTRRAQPVIAAYDNVGFRCARRAQ